MFYFEGILRINSARVYRFMDKTRFAGKIYGCTQLADTIYLVCKCFIEGLCVLLFIAQTESKKKSSKEV